MFYKNMSLSVKTFYGVEFKPGEIHEVPGFINDIKFAAVEKKPSESSKLHRKSSERTVVESTSTESDNNTTSIDKEEKSNG